MNERKKERKKEKWGKKKRKKLRRERDKTFMTLEFPFIFASALAVRPSKSVASTLASYGRVRVRG